MRVQLNRNLEAKPLLVFLLLIFSLSFFSFGCSDTTYLSERLFWEAERGAEKIYQKGLNKFTDADYEKIIALYQKVVDSCPLEKKAAKAQFAIAGIYNSQGKYTQAQKQFVEVINNFSSNPKISSEAQLAIAKLYEAQGKWQVALEEYDKLMDLYPLTPLGLTMPQFIVNYYLNKNDSQGAEKAYIRGVRHYQKTIKDFSETDVVPALQDYLARFHSEHGDYEQAIEVWNQIIDNSPGSEQATRALLLKAETYVQGLGNREKAISAYRDFIQQQPRYKELADIKVRLGILYLEAGQSQEAKNVYLSLLKDHPDNETVAIKAHMGLSYCYRKELNSEKVIEIYDKIKTLYPDSQAGLSVPFLTAQYYEELKSSSLARQAYEQAIVEYQAVLEDDAKSELTKKEVTNFLTLCYIKTKQVTKALQLLRMLSERYPREPMYLLDMATLYINLNDIPKAIKIYKEILIKYANDRLMVRLAKQQIQALTLQAAQ